MADRADPIRVLFIGGWGRCGSTLLDLMLGQIPGLVSAGEVREIWLRGCVENRPCGCGRPFHDCPFWTAVGERAFGGWDGLDLKRTLTTRYRLDRPWGLPRLMAPRAWDRADSDITAYTEGLQRLYSAIAAVADARAVVDSSKIPSHALLLRRATGLDARVLHLVRDSRGVAYSNTKRVEKVSTDGAATLLPQHGSTAASARFVFYNGLTSALRAAQMPYRLLRYEDLINSPVERLREIAAYAGLDTDASFPFLADSQLTLSENHLVDGNPVRFAANPLLLRTDEQWRTKMPTRDRALVTALTLPMLVGYRYPLGYHD
jgi:hypothetical protein